MKQLRIALAILAVALTAVPLAVVAVTDIGWGETASHTVISLSILCVIGAILLGAKKGTDRYFVKIGASIGLLIVLLSLWV